MVFWIFPCHSDMINCLSKPDVDFTSNVMQLQLRLTFFHYVVDQASIEWKVNTDQKGDISFFSRSLFKHLKKMVEKLKIIFCINMFYWKKKNFFVFLPYFLKIGSLYYPYVKGCLKPVRSLSDSSDCIGLRSDSALEWFW